MNSNLSANAEINLASRLANIKSIDEMASQAVRLCAEAAEASICTFWRRYDDPDDQPRLRLAAAYGVEAPASLAQEVTYAIAAKKESFEHIGITGYVASA